MRFIHKPLKNLKNVQSNHRVNFSTTLQGNFYSKKKKEKKKEIVNLKKMTNVVSHGLKIYERDREIRSDYFGYKGFIA